TAKPCRASIVAGSAMLMWPPPEPCRPMTAGKRRESLSGTKQSMRTSLPPLCRIVCDWETENMDGIQPLTDRLMLFRQLPQRLLIRRLRDAMFGHNRGYVFCGGHVEGGILYLGCVRDHLLAGNVSHFFRIPLFNGDLAAVGGPQVNRG